MCPPFRHVKQQQPQLKAAHCSEWLVWPSTTNYQPEIWIRYLIFRACKWDLVLTMALGQLNLREERLQAVSLKLKQILCKWAGSIWPELCLKTVHCALYYSKCLEICKQSNVLLSWIWVKTKAKKTWKWYQLFTGCVNTQVKAVRQDSRNPGIVAVAELHQLSYWLTMLIRALNFEWRKKHLWPQKSQQTGSLD